MVEYEPTSRKCYTTAWKNRRCSDSHHTLYTEIIGICYIERRCDMKLKTGIKTFYDEDGNKTGVLITMKEFEKLIEELEIVGHTHCL